MRRRKLRSSRRATILVLSALLLVLLLAMIGFGVDVGYIVLVKTQLQNAADSAALAAAASMGRPTDQVVSAAQEFAGYHRAGGRTVSLNSTDVEFGTWNATARSFTPTAQLSNAIRVTARRNNTSGGNNLFFGRALGVQSFSTQASAIAMGNPRDIAFVVDLSGSMNDDTEPGWATTLLTAELSPQGYPNVANNLMTTLYSDLGFGAFPGTLQWIGYSKGVTANNRAYAALTRNSGPLTGSSINSNYRISSSNSESTRKQKAYRYIIEQEIAVLMPAARPAATNANFSFWEKYLDYIMENVTVNSGTGTPPSNRGALPPNQDSDRITGLNNPNSASFPSASDTEVEGFRNRIGYRTFVQFMLDNGRNVQPDGSNYCQASVSSPYCSYHNEATAGGTFSFPPREQPVHACRRSLIAAMQEVLSRNSTVPDPAQRDWVSVISFDTVSGTVVRQALTSDYQAAMQACTRLQAVGDNVSSTATETGMIAARNHISPPSSGGVGRLYTQKIVVVLTDGMPNLYSSSNGTISSYRSANPSSDFFGGSNYALDAPLMQAMTMQISRWQVFPVGLGLGTDYNFLDRMARMGSTANDNGESPRSSGNPVAYEQQLTDIFRNIITNPQVRLVK